MKLLTNLLFEPKGKHDPALAYNIKDTVMSADGSKVYFALQDVPAGIALSNGDYWKLQIDLSSSKSAMDQALASFADYAKVIGMRVRGETAKASGKPVTFLPDAGSLIQPVTVLEPQQAGSGDPSPSNIRPFIGYDKLGLTQCGDNLLNYDMWQYIGMQRGTAVFENNGVTITALEDDAYTNDGLGFEDVENTYLAKIPVNPGESITLSWEADRSYSANIYIFPNADPSKLVVCNNNENRPLVYTATDGVSFATLRFSATKAGDVISYRNIMVNKGTEAMPFKPWQGKTNTVQIGQTVYGGKFDWLTGKLIAEWAGVALTGNEEVNTFQQHEHLRFNVLGVASNIMPAEAANLNMVCSHYSVSPEPVQANAINNAVCSYLNYGDLYIRDDAHASAEAYKAYLAAQHAAGTPVQIAYKLAQPIEIQLEPTIIAAVEPEQTNTLYGDGRIDVTYVKPLHVSIEERVAAALAAAKE